MFEDLFAKRLGDIKPGLGRMRLAHTELGYPCKDTPGVLIGGTNGKGTTAGFLWMLLNRCDSRVGLFSSPHLVRFSERYCFSHRDFEDNDVKVQHEILKNNLSTELYQSLSFFEIATLIAMQAFAFERNHLNIFEVGLGGQWDATNILDLSCSAIVSISKDHEKFLGSTIREITLEKAGIIKEGRPVFLGDFFASTAGEESNEIIREVAANRHSEVFISPSAPPDNDGEFSRLSQELKPLWSRSEVMRRNFLLAYQVYGYLKRFLPRLDSYENRIKIPPTLIGRYQSLVLENRQRKELILDVCHNIAGVQQLVGYVSQKGYTDPIPAFISILSDKDINPMLDLLRGIFSPIVLFKIDNIRSFGIDDLAERHKYIEIFESFSAAWRCSIVSWDTKKPWVVCGSVAAVGDVIGYFSADQNFADEFVLHGVDPSI